jgi:MarR family transcriptional repressor of emrRAB
MDAMSRYEERLQHHVKALPASVRDAALATRLLFHAARRLEERIDELLRPHGLEMREYLLLAILKAQRAEAMRPSELSVSLDAPRPKVTRLLDGLEQRGLLRRRLAAQDRRGLDVELTAAGTQLLAEVAPLMHRGYKEWWSSIGPEGLDGMVGSLRQVNAALGEGNAA